MLGFAGEAARGAAWASVGAKLRGSPSRFGNAPGRIRTSDLRFQPDPTVSRRAGPAHRPSRRAVRLVRAPGASAGRRGRVAVRGYCRGGSPAGLYTFRRPAHEAPPRRRLGSGLPAPPRSRRGEGFPEFTRFATRRFRRGPLFVKETVALSCWATSA